MKNKEEIARKLVDGESYVNRLDSKKKLRVIPYLTGSVLVVIVIVSIVTKDILDGILWSFFAMGFFAFLIAALYLPIKKSKDYSSIKKCIEDELDRVKPPLPPGEKERLTRDHLGTFFSPVTRQIMSLGVIPIIFAILGIILFVDRDVPEIIQNINVLMFLIIIGGIAEAVAFFIGYIHPEPEASTKTGLESSDIKALTNVIEALLNKIPTEGILKIGDINLTLKSSSTKKKGKQKEINKTKNSNKE